MDLIEIVEDEAEDRGYETGYKDAHFDLLEQLRKADFLYDSKEGIVEYLTFYIEGILEEDK